MCVAEGQELPRPQLAPDLLPCQHCKYFAAFCVAEGQELPRPQLAPDLLELGSIQVSGGGVIS